MEPVSRAHSRPLADPRKVRAQPVEAEVNDRVGWFADVDGCTMIGGMMELIEHFRTAACRLPIAHVWCGHGSALFVELGALTPRTHRDGSPSEPEGAIGMMIEWSWRIEDGRSIACGSSSDEDLWPLAFARLVGRTVEDLSTFGHLPEIVLSLSGDLRVASFMTAEGDPAWALFDRRGPQVITACCRAGVIDLEQE